MKVLQKILMYVFVSTSFLIAVPEVGKTAPDFTIYNLETEDLGRMVRPIEEDMVFYRVVER